MKTIICTSILFGVLLLAACQRESAPVAASADPDSAASKSSTITDWPLPSTTGAAQPDLIISPDGRLLLSWISAQPGRRHALQFAAYTDTWQSAPKTIAVGQSLFVNWADTPHLAMTADGALWVHWLQKSADKPYAYDVLLSRSINNGLNWIAPVRVHDDGTTTEHGFVSMWPASRDTLGIAWLDGRNTSGGDHAQAGHGGAMTLRAATFNSLLQRTQDAELDASTCECCQTDAAMTSKGALVVYRDRTTEEIRDIFTTRSDGQAWSAPKAVHSDNWTMPACPVNGPSLAAQGGNAYVAWYTAAGNTPTLRIARSNDAGDTFSKPVDVQRGNEVQGRVDVAFDGLQVWVVWLNESDIAQTLWLARYSADLSRQLERIEVAKLQGRGRGTGFPQLALRDGGAWLVWTDVLNGQPHLRGAHVRLQ
ncbi:MAG: glycoside hydrolase [Lysobacter sp.]|nr:glycoside hydrolase [Lysobacter sp.]